MWITILELFLTFLKIGAFTFGGGYAMIPLVTDEVISNGWLTSEQVLNFIAVAESTPGPIAINMATFVGSSQAGILGSVAATLGVVLPSFIIILVIASIMRGLLKFAGVQAFLKGIRPVVVGLIVGTAINIFLTVVLSLSTVYDSVAFDWKSLIIFLLIATTHVVYKKIKKKNLSVIILILLSAALGVLFYGII
jgi:chromate transporter